MAPPHDMLFQAASRLDAAVEAAIKTVTEGEAPGHFGPAWEMLHPVDGSTDTPLPGSILLLKDGGGWGHTRIRCDSNTVVNAVKGGADEQLDAKIDEMRAYYRSSWTDSAASEGAFVFSHVAPTFAVWFPAESQQQKAVIKWVGPTNVSKDKKKVNPLLQSYSNRVGVIADDVL